MKLRGLLNMGVLFETTSSLEAMMEHAYSLAEIDVNFWSVVQEFEE